MSTYDALVQGGRTRVRPIIMTAVATMIALMPLVLGFSEGSIIAAELGTVVVGGLFTSTLLTLLVVPVAYSLLDGLRSRFGRRSPEAEETPPTRKVEATSTRPRKSPFIKPAPSTES
jgi:predicted RND superfamily exporter protein